MLLVWENLQWGFRDVGYCFSFIVVLHSLMSLHFRATSPCHRHSGTVKGSTSSELYPGYFRLLLPFHLPRTLQFWVGIFYPQTLFTLRSFPDIFDTTCFYQGFPGSRQFFLEVCRASCWSSKHRPGSSVCLIHSNPQSSYSEEFVFKSY